MWPTVFFAASLILLSTGLLLSHLLARRTHQAAELDSEEDVYRRRQFRRRVQASGLIGLVGLAVLGGLWVDGPPFEALYWSGVLLAVIWILVLAGADAASTQSFFREMQKRRADEHRALQDEIEQYRRHEGNGQHQRKGKAEK